MATDAEISVVASDGSWQVRVRGAVDGDDSIRRLEEVFDEAIAWSADDVVLDLTDTVELSPQAIDVILDARRTLTALDRQLIVVPESQPGLEHN